MTCPRGINFLGTRAGFSSLPLDWRARLLDKWPSLSDDYIACRAPQQAHSSRSLAFALRCFSFRGRVFGRGYPATPPCREVTVPYPVQPVLSIYVDIRPSDDVTQTCVVRKQAKQSAKISWKMKQRGGLRISNDIHDASRGFDATDPLNPVRVATDQRPSDAGVGQHESIRGTIDSTIHCQTKQQRSHPRPISNYRSR